MMSAFGDDDGSGGGGGGADGKPTSQSNKLSRARVKLLAKNKETGLSYWINVSTVTICHRYIYFVLSQCFLKSSACT